MKNKSAQQLRKEFASSGGKATLEKYGRDHFKRIAKGWPKGKKRKKK